MLHQKQAGFGEVITVKELAAWRSTAPHGDLREAISLRLVKAPDQGREDVRVLRMEVVVRPKRLVGIAAMKFDPYCFRYA